MENLSLMKAKADKAVRDGQFSMVDNELDEIHNSIINQTINRIYEDDHDSQHEPFQSFQNDIRVKGKNLQFKSAKFIASCFARPEVHLKSKETQTYKHNPLEEKVKELQLLNENLEDKLSAKLKEIDNCRYHVSKLAKDKTQLKDEIEYLKEKNEVNEFKIDEFDKNIKRKLKMIDELAIEILNLKKEIYTKNK